VLAVAALDKSLSMVFMTSAYQRFTAVLLLLLLIYGSLFGYNNFKKYKMKVKGKAIPLQAWTDPEGSRRLRLLDFKTIGT